MYEEPFADVWEALAAARKAFASPLVAEVNCKCRCNMVVDDDDLFPSWTQPTANSPTNCQFHWNSQFFHTLFTTQVNPYRTRIRLVFGNKTFLIFFLVPYREDEPNPRMLLTCDRKISENDPPSFSGF